MSTLTNGEAAELPSSCPVSLFELPRQRKEVLIIAMKAFALGVLTAADVYALVVAYSTDNIVLLALSVYILCACLSFHISEFVLAFLSRPHDAHAGAFMLYHSTEYTAAQLIACIEFFIQAYFVPSRYKLCVDHHHWLSLLFRLNVPGICIFAALTLLFYTIRLVAMWQCAHNFSLRVQHTRYATHMFVQHGLYRYLRHPAYFGWFWRTMCAQLILANPVSFVLHTVVTWLFFADVIPSEERSMEREDYFGDAYKIYRHRTWSWAVALSIPAFLIGGYVASRKRLAYQWREELMDMDGGIYSTVCDDDMRHFCRVLPRREFATSRATPRAPSIKLDAPHDANRHDGANDGDGETCRVRPLTPKENIGLYVRRDAITPECGAVLLTEIRRLARTVGSALDARKVQSFRWRAEMHAHDCGADSLVRATNARHPLRNQTAVLQGERVPQADGAEEEESVMDASFYEHIRVISDHAEDTQAMHAPWGCGDRLDLSKMPSYLRGLVAHMQRHFENVGRLRHVYIEYSPTGNFFREPRSPSGYDGHDYLLLALRRDGAGTVITMSPNTRSRYPRLDEVRRYSWTSYDVDALLPAQCVLRVYGSARYDYGWGVRPGRVWFGSWHNPVPRAMPSSCLVACSSKGEKGRAVHVATEAVRRRLIDWMGSSRALSRVWHARRPHPRDGEAATSPSLPSGSEELSLRHEAAMVVLHFEGPRSQKGQRSLLLHPEALIFGRAPTPEVFETWVDDTPTPQSVREEGLIHFIVHNYSNMWAAS